MEGGQKLYALYHLSTGLLGGQGDTGGVGASTGGVGGLKCWNTWDRTQMTFEEKLILGEAHGYATCKVEYDR